MLGLLLLSSFAFASVMAAAGLFDGVTPSPDSDPFDFEPDRDLTLFDEAQIRELATTLMENSILPPDSVESGEDLLQPFEELGQSLSLLDDTKINTLEAILGENPLRALEGSETSEDPLQLYVDESGYGIFHGGEGRDLIVVPEEFVEEHDAICGGDDNDVIIGNSIYDPIFGDEGNDLLFGRGGDDALFGDEGNDTASGSEGHDIIVGGFGADLLYGGAGNDNIYDNLLYTNFTNADGADGADVIVSGAGDDGIVLNDGVNLVSLGEGEDHLLVYGEKGENPGAIVTDFNPAEDALLLGVYAPDVSLPEGTNSMELSYTLSEIETTSGPATVVTPAFTEVLTVNSLGNGSSVGYAVLIGVTPADLANAEIRVVLQNHHTSSFDDGSIESIARAMGATRI